MTPKRSLPPGTTSGHLRRPGVAWPLIVWALAAVPMWVQLERQDYMDQTIRPVLVVSLGATLLAHQVPRLSWIFAATAAVGLVSFDRYLPAEPMVLFAVLASMWVVVTRVVVPRAAFLRAPAVSASIPALAVTDLLLVLQKGLRAPLATTAAAVLLALGAAARPQVARHVAELATPAARAGRRFGRANRKLMDRLGQRGGGFRRRRGDGACGPVVDRRLDRPSGRPVRSPRSAVRARNQMGCTRGHGSPPTSRVPRIADSRPPRYRRYCTASPRAL